jgi:hypothetical protein
MDQCPKGHPFTPDNLIIRPEGGRRCRICKNQLARNRYWAKGKQRVRVTRTTLVNILDRCSVDENGCWLWQGFLNAHGYGRTKWQGRNQLVHRIVYELMEAPVPDGLSIDHLCRVRHCVNPGHLEVVTSRENTLRGETIPAEHLKKTHCHRGHEFTPENTYPFGPDKKWRQCKACHKVTGDLRKQGIVSRPASVGRQKGVRRYKAPPWEPLR